MLVQGIHHVCIRCEKSEIEKVKEFYQGVLGMPVIRSWGEPELAGFMFDTGAGLVEVFTDAEGQLPQGSIRHFALKTDDVDGCVKAVCGICKHRRQHSDHRRAKRHRDSVPTGISGSCGFLQRTGGRRN